MTPEKHMVSSPQMIASRGAQNDRARASETMKRHRTENHPALAFSSDRAKPRIHEEHL